MKLAPGLLDGRRTGRSRPTRERSRPTCRTSSPPATSCRRARHRARGRPGPAGCVHDRPLAAGRGAGRGELRREAAGRRQGRGAGEAASGPRPPGAAGAEPRLCAAPDDFAELEPALTEAEARYGAERCLDCGPCSECGQCVAVCEADAIDLTMRDAEVELEVGAIIVATGFKPFDPQRIPEYGYGKYPNVYTSLEVERLLNASGPTQGEIVMRNGGRPRRSASSTASARGTPVQRLLLPRVLHVLAEARPPDQGAHRGRGLQLLHRHADPGQGVRGVLQQGAWRRACTSSVAASPR